MRVRRPIFMGMINSVAEIVPPADTDAFYVSNTGSSDGDGSYSSPWSLSYALNGAADGSITAGKSVYLLEGTYEITSKQVVDGLTGDSDNLITFQPYSGRVTLRNNGGDTDSFHDTLEIQDVAFTDFKDLELTMFNYDRSTEIDVGAGIYHITENGANAQSNVRFIACRIHDSVGGAVKSVETSSTIEYHGCLFYYNGGNDTVDDTMFIQGDASCNKVVASNVFLHNAGDAIKIYSDTDGADLEDIEIDGNIILNPGALYGVTQSGIVCFGESEIATNIDITDNVYAHALTNDTDTLGIRLGDFGGGTSTGEVDVSMVTWDYDGRWNTNGDFNRSSTLVVVGYSSGYQTHGFFHFEGIEIPVGATITEAWLEFHHQTALSSTKILQMSIYAEKTVDADAPPSTASDADAKTLTTAYVNYDLTGVAVAYDAVLQTPDIKTVIQELVDDASWSAATDTMIGIYVKERGGVSNDDIWIAAYEHATGLEPRLFIGYEVAGDVGVNTANVLRNTVVGSPVNFDDGSYTSVTIENNTFIYDSDHIGASESTFTSNNWIDNEANTGVMIICRPLEVDDKIANIVIFNWGDISPVTINHTDLVGVDISSDDAYVLHNVENYYSDTISGTYDGSSIEVPMVGRSQATPAGSVSKPTSLYPSIGIFQLVVDGGGGDAPSGADTTAPSVPADLAGSVISQTQIDLTWTASTDDVAVLGYTVYTEGVQVATAETSYSLTSLAPGTEYSIQVDAFDAAGNRSAKCAAISKTTTGASTDSYYVSVSGSSDGDGSSTDAWNIEYALAGADSTIQPGDTILIQDGTYSFSTDPYLYVDGSAGDPVMFKPDTDADVKFELPVGSVGFRLMGTSYVDFYDIEFVQESYSRATPSTSVGLEGMIIQNSGVAQSNVRFFGCTFHDSKGMGLKLWQYNTGLIEFNGCLIYYNGSDPQHDHGVYSMNQPGYTKRMKDCIIHNNAGYNLHMYSGYTDRHLDDYDLDGCVVYNPTTLYDWSSDNPSQKQNLFIGGYYLENNDNTIQNCLFWSVPSQYTYEVRLGYNGNASKDVTITDNISCGRPWYLAEGTLTGTVTGNLIMCPGGLDSDTEAIFAASTDNYVLGVPISGEIVNVRAYDWDAKRANVTIFNHAEANTITVYDSDFVAAGVTLANGNSYELRNSEDFYSDVITGTYDGTSIEIDMQNASRSQATPIGGIPTPDSAFPRFGCFVLRNLS